MDDNAVILGRFLQTFLTEGPEAAAQFVHPEVVADEPPSMPYGGTYRGRTEFLDLMRRMAETVVIDVRDYQLFESGDTVIARFDSTFVNRITGDSVALPMVGIYTFADGVIARTDMFYKDTHAFAAASERAGR